MLDNAWWRPSFTNSRLCPRPLPKSSYSNQKLRLLQKRESSEEASCENLERVAIDNDPEKFFQVGVQLPPQEKQELIEFLRENVDVFAWKAYEAPGVDPDFICHHLNVNPSITPRKQPPIQKPL